MLDYMITLASEVHHGQFDKSGKPYILHPLAVMRILNSDDDELNCIAVGHDILEDYACITTTDLYYHGFSPRVIEGIVALTRVKNQTTTEYLTQICANRDAILVKMADIRHNSDFTRLKGVTEEDCLRMRKYMLMYATLEKALASHTKNEVELLKEELKEAKHQADGYYRTLEYIKETLGPLVKD